MQNQQGRIACLYLPIIGLLLDNLDRLTWPSLRSTATATRAPTPPTTGAAAGASTRRGDGRSSTRSKASRSVSVSEAINGSLGLIKQSIGQSMVVLICQTMGVLIGQIMVVLSTVNGCVV